MPNTVRSNARSILRRLDQTLGTILFHTQTLWLFTYSDLKTIIIPSTIFGITNALAADRYGITIPLAAAIPPHTDINTHHPPTHPLLRTPLILLWVYLNFLPFAIANQLSPSSIAEDALNKPWRPLPRGRITPRHARTLMLALYAAAQLGNALLLGAARQGGSLVLLGMWYNSFGGADVNPLVRNGINALGYVCFTSGALEVAVGGEVPLPLLGGGGGGGGGGFWGVLGWSTEVEAGGCLLPRWLGVIAAVIVTTIHAMDLYDQEGDAARGRRTVPLVVGDAPARWIIAVWMLVWGVVCPSFWNAMLVARAVSLGLAGLVAVRVLAIRNVAADKRSFVVWNVWMSFVYLLPLCGRPR